eukprot:m.356181 g.356181  ORF g.356181 m.356181 type:complete len:76 (-) comp17457_c0_seq1:164-391(-)
MARGQQKIQAQQKTQAKRDKAAKQKGHKASDHATAAAKATQFICSVCKSAMASVTTYKMHWDSKHSKLPYPEELK